MSAAGSTADAPAPGPVAGFGTPTLRLTTEQHAEILASCYDAGDEEACGLLVGPVLPTGEPAGTIVGAHRARNADHSARTYTVEPRDYLRAMRAAEAAGAEIVGVWHSHTHTVPYPSQTDVRQAVDPMWIYVLVGLAPGDPPTMRAYRIRDGLVAELPVVVEGRRVRAR